MIKNPQELQGEINRSNYIRVMSLIPSMGGTALAVTGILGLTHPNEEINAVVIESASKITTIAGATIAMGGIVSAIYWGNRHNALESTQTELILSGAVPPEDFRLQQVHVEPTTSELHQS